MVQPVDRSILQEIVRVIESRKKVPERVQVRAREYLITYLEDHQRRLEEALHRYDSDRLNMLYGQLASKVKYQLQRRLPGAAAPAEKKPAPKPPTKKAKGTAAGKQPGRPKPPVKAAAKKSAVAAKVQGSKTAVGKGRRPAAAEKKPAARKK